MKLKNVCIGFVALLMFSCSSTTTTPEKYQTSNKENMEEVYKFMKDCGCYFIATAEGNQPRVRPFGTVNIYENKLYIQTGHVKRIAEQISKNPKIEICAYNGTTQWMRVEATLVEDNRVEPKKAMLDAYPSLKKMYNAEDDNTAVYYLTNATAWLSSFTDSTKTIKF